MSKWSITDGKLSYVDGGFVFPVDLDTFKPLHEEMKSRYKQLKRTALEKNSLLENNTAWGKITTAAFVYQAAYENLHSHLNTVLVKQLYRYKVPNKAIADLKVLLRLTPRFEKCIKELDEQLALQKKGQVIIYVPSIPEIQ